MSAVLTELSAPPALRPLLAKAALAGLRRGAPRELPSTVYAISNVTVSTTELADYNRVCGFGLTDRLPATYPHLFSFPLQMKLMTGADFPFPPMGTVHVANRITVHFPIAVTDRIELRVHAANLREHQKGKQFDLVTEAYVDGELAWQEVCGYLRRGGGSASAAQPEQPEPERIEPSASWRVGDDAGRRYAEVSGDVNPIHLYALTARAFGFPRAIAHGMWTKARCLALLENRLPERYTVDVSFHKPVLLPSTVAFGTAVRDGRRDFELCGAQNGKPHLRGSITTP